MAGTKRRLPVLQPANDAAQGGGAPRLPWQWAGFGALATIAAWLPLASLAEVAKRRFVFEPLLGRAPVDDPVAVRAALAMASPATLARLVWAVRFASASPLVLAGFAGGFLVGRWEPPSRAESGRVRDAALGGFGASLAAVALGLASEGARVDDVLSSLPALVIGTACAALGGAYGVRRSRGTRALRPS